MSDNVNRLFDMVKATAAVAGDIAGGAVDAAGRKVNELWSGARLQIEVVDLQNEINAIHKELGLLVYEAHINPEAQHEGVEEKLRVLDEKNAALRDVKARIDSIKQINRCMNEKCGAQVDKNDSFCRFCGTDLHTAPGEEDGENAE